MNKLEKLKKRLDTLIDTCKIEISITENYIINANDRDVNELLKFKASWESQLEALEYAKLCTIRYEYKIGDEVKSKQTGLRCIINKFETNMRHEDVVVLIGDEGTLKLERDYFEKNFILIKACKKSIKNDSKNKDLQLLLDKCNLTKEKILSYVECSAITETPRAVIESIVGDNYTVVYEDERWSVDI
jgi:hypothetical protein